MQNSRLFLLSCVSLLATSMTFAIRANLLPSLFTEFHLTATQAGFVTGTAFWGFALSVLVGGFICKSVGYRALLIAAATFHFVGIGWTMVAGGFWDLFFSTLLIGIGNGFVEAACNPLIVQLYPDAQIKMLNRFHVWFPGGIVIGGLLGYALTQYGIGWQGQVSVILVPVIVYALLLFTSKLPKVESAAGQTDLGKMMKACVSPFFIVMLVGMFFSATTELGTNQWVTKLLETVGVPGILLLVFINGIMMTGRTFAGELLHKVSGRTILVASAFISALGLFLLSVLTGPAVFAGAGIFALGVCFFWPTMLGYTSTVKPDIGPLGLSIIGSGGMLFVGLISPIIGNLFDSEQTALLTNGTDPIVAGQLAGQSTLRILIVLPGILLILLQVANLISRKSQYGQTAAATS